MSAMRTKHLILPFLFSGLLSTATNQSHAKEGTKESHLLFVENKGQVTDQHGNARNDIRFRIGDKNLNLFVGYNGLHYQWSKLLPTSKVEQQKIALNRMDVTLLHANPDAQVITGQKQEYYERYYLSRSGQQGIKANSFQKITYKDIYPNIDWVLYVKDNTIEYDFVLHPTANVSDIKIQYNGATNLQINKEGKLIATTPSVTITENTPNSFQQDGKTIASHFILENNILGFSVAPYTGTLTIDPTLNWATYYGGTGEETIKGNAVTGDQNGNAYLCGYTNSATNIATTGSFKDTLTVGTAIIDAFLVKFNSAGARQWATYYGGGAADYAWATACDPTGNVYMTGYTNNAGLATTGSYQTTVAGNTDAYLVKFDSTGQRLWSTYYGGTAAEQGYAVATDVSGNVFLAGYTNNSALGIATTGAQQTTGGGGNDAFLVKFNSNGVRQWGTYCGGSSTDQAFGIACDNNKNVFLTGYTQSATNIATTGSHQSVNGGTQDGFIVKYDSMGIRQWGTYYGGTSTDQCKSVACDANGNSYISGYTLSGNGIASTGSFQTTFGGGPGADAFISKFNSNGIRQWATYYGNTGDESGYGICTDNLGHVYATGCTGSTTGMATTNAIQDSMVVQDAYIVKFDTAGTRLWGTYLGGDDTEIGYGIFCNNLSKVFVGGTSSSVTNLATTGAYQTIKGGGYNDAFLARIDDCSLTAPTGITGNDTVCRNAIYTYTTPNVTGAVSYNWTLPNGWTGTSISNTIMVTASINAGNANTLTDTIKVSANFLCGTSDAVTKLITISPLPIIAPTGTISLCNGDTAMLTTNNIPGAINYQWLKNDTIINGATNHDLQTQMEGLYSVIVTNSNGCTDTSMVDTVIVHPLPTPAITANGLVLSTGNFTSYQWNHNNTPIVGATGQSYTITIQSGNYSVTVTDSNGCAATSATYDATPQPTGIDDANINGNQSVNIYPNPATDYLIIKTSGKVDIAISSIDGKRIGFFKNTNRIDISTLEAGVYLLYITDNHGAFIASQKVVKCPKH